MNSIENIEQVLEVEQKLKLEGDARPIIVVVESIDARSMGIRSDSSPSDLLSLRLGAKLRATFLKDDTVVYFETTVTKKTNPPARVFLSLPRTFVSDKMEYYQRLGFTGVEGFIPFRYQVVTPGKDKAISFPESGSANWIGGNELNMITVENITKGSLLAIELGLPITKTPLRLFGRVDKIRPHGSLNHVRLIFEALSEADRDIILKYCLKKQAESHKL